VIFIASAWYYRVIVPRDWRYRVHAQITRSHASLASVHREGQEIFFLLIMQRFRHIYIVWSILPRFLNVPKRIYKSGKFFIYLWSPQEKIVYPAKREVDGTSDKHACQLGLLERNKMSASAISELLLPLFQNKSWCTTFHIYGNEIFLHGHCLANQTHVHMKGWAPGLVLKQR